jgi:hypothetical protein
MLGFWLCPAARENLGFDWEGEWFPALTGRAAPLTVQASEWLPDHGFARQQKRYDQVSIAPLALHPAQRDY